MKSPTQVIHKIYEKVSDRFKFSFIISLIIGMITHGYIILNNYPNSDGVIRMDHFDSATIFGRWFLRIICYINSEFNLPWIIGVQAVVFLSCAVAIIISIFNVDNKVYIILISGLIVTFPAIASTFSYLFLADGYMFAFLLAVLAVKLCNDNNKYGVILGAISLAFSMGCYQAYLGVCMVLIIIILLVELITSEILDKKRFAKKILRFLIMGIIGVLLYWIILNIFLDIQNVNLVGYQGLDAMNNGVQISSIIKGVIKAYQDVISFYSIPVISSNSGVKFILYINIMVIVYLTIKVIIKNKLYRQFLRIVLICGLILLLPIALNINLVISPDVFYHMVMRQAWAFLLIIPMVLFSALEHSCKREGQYADINGVKWVSVIISVIICINYINVSNIAYISMETKYERTYGLMNRIADRIENYEGFNYDIPVLFVGAIPNKYYADTKLSDKIMKGMTGVERNALLGSDVKHHVYLENVLGITLQRTSSQQREIIMGSEELKVMDVFPSQSSIAIMNGVLVIKVG